MAGFRGLRACLLLLLMVALCNVDVIGISPFAQYSSCSTVCRCFNNQAGQVSVKCNISGEHISRDEIQLPPKLYSLDLSNNNLSTIPTSSFQNYSEITNLSLDDNSLKNLTSTAALRVFPFLKYLSFRRNAIKLVKSDFFEGLNHLIFLNLGLNDLDEWSGNLSCNTPDLQILDITGTTHWIPDENILALPKLQELRGVSWCIFCPNCTVINPHNLVNESGGRRRKAEECLRQLDEMKFLEFGRKEPKQFIKRRFVPECMCVKQSECEFRHIVMPYFKKRTSLPQHLFLIEFVLSPLTIVMNLIVIMTVLTSKSLRKTPSFVLTGHMGGIDLLIGIYSIWVAHTNTQNIDAILEEIMWTGRELQPSTGPIFIAGQLISVAISLLLTLERYLVVIYCMNPLNFMSVKDCHILLLLAWSGAITFAVLPIFGVGGLHYNIKRACTPLSYHEEFNSGSSLILLTSLVVILVLYVITLPLYVHIFIFVKKSSNKMGVKREFSLARKIALLVFTNFIFFTIPILIVLVFSIFAKFDDNPFDFEEDAFKSTIFKITIGQWLPVTCLNINSLLDPFLYAFRHENFKREIRRQVRRLSNKVLPFRSLNSSGDSTADDTSTKTRSAAKRHFMLARPKDKGDEPVQSEIKEQ